MSDGLFERLCIRCGQCLRSCPSGILQPSGLAQGMHRLWTPWANADWAGCEATCNNCGQVCPTGAIAALSLDQKMRTRMGLAEVNQSLCLPFQGRNDCRTADGLVCLDACQAAGYSAIVVDGDANPSPSVLTDRCVGCGLCQARCYRVNVVERKLLPAAAIRVAHLSAARAASAPGKAPPPTTAPATTKPQGIEVPYAVPED